jgi:hypothetical protein
MRKLFISALMLALAGPALASDGAKFDAKKALVLKALAQRQDVLHKEQACVQAATQQHQLQQCMHAAKQERDGMGAQLRQEAQALHSKR